MMVMTTGVSFVVLRFYDQDNAYSLRTTPVLNNDMAQTAQHNIIAYVQWW